MFLLVYLQFLRIQKNLNFGYYILVVKKIASTGSIVTTINFFAPFFSEHLGGFLPLLKGKRVSKLRPEFIIYDPQLPQDVETGNCSWHNGVPQLSGKQKCCIL